MSQVDVVVPCYKYGHYLRGCVESVLSQQGVDVRVLVIDDCSPDCTPDVAAQLESDDSRVQYRRHTVNCGHIDTYNEGLLGWARGDYSLLLSADDMLLPGALARAARVLDTFPDVGLTYGREVKAPTPETLVQPAPNEYQARILSGEEFVRNSCEEGGNIVPTPTAVVRTALQQRIGGYRKDLPHAGDMEMWLRFAAHGSVGVIETHQAFYRIHGHNMSKEYPGICDFEQRKAAFDHLFEHYASKMHNCAELRTLAYRRLAEAAFWSASHKFDRCEGSDVGPYLELAFRLDRRICRTGSWMRFRCKRLLGMRAWARLRPLANALRARPRLASAGA